MLLLVLIRQCNTNTYEIKLMEAEEKYYDTMANVMGIV